MIRTQDLISTLFVSLLLSSCAPDTRSTAEAVRPLEASEKLLDFDLATSYFKSFYAPLQYKEKLLNVDYDNVFAQLREEAASSKNDQEFYQVLGKLVASMKDGHVSVQIPRLTRYTLPFFLDYLDGKYIIVEITDQNFSETTGIKVGDEVLNIDGKEIEEIAQSQLHFTTLGYEKADKRLGAFLASRASYIKPESLQSFVKVKRSSDGAVFVADTFWSVSKKSISIETDLNSHKMFSTIGDTSINQFGAPESFFYTPAAKGKFKFTKIAIPQDEWNLEFGDKPANIFALLYKFEGKTVLLVRIPSYGVNDEEHKRNIQSYKQILQKYENLADVLVIDQTHNPGGSVSYVEDLASLFLKNPGPSMAFKPRADRLWLTDISDWLNTADLSEAFKKYLKNAYTVIEESNERGDFLGPQIALTRTSATLTEVKAWNKPVLLLIDELCGSGGDAFPMILKGNKAATLFGHRTAGMGGNVSSMDALPHSGAQFKLTRSLFYLASPDGTLSDEAIIENNGVSPDIQRDYGLVDYKEGFVTYIEDFSKAAIGLIKEVN